MLASNNQRKKCVIVAKVKFSQKATLPPISPILNFSCSIILAAMEAVIGVEKLRTEA